MQKIGKMWSFIVAFFCITLIMLAYIKTKPELQTHAEYELSGRDLFNFYCIRCHASSVGIKRNLMTQSGNMVNLDFFAKILYTKHGKQNFNEVLFESDIEPLYRAIIKK